MCLFKIRTFEPETSESW